MSTMMRQVISQPVIRYACCRQLMCIEKALLALGLGIVVLLTSMAPVMAQSGPDTPLVGYRTGTVTAIHGETLDIDGASYQLAPNVVIVSPTEQPMEPASICVTAEVKFQVKREQPSRIVKMVLYLPQ
ncbi:MAG: hypothetical protein U0172_12580 [Nitrospiraceae bacterium]